MIKKIDIELTEIDRIFHVSDVHIRNLKRHAEYRTVFCRLCDTIKSKLTKNSVIFLAGDIAHAKTDMSPELCQEIQEFFRMMADIAPTILITGNHDSNLNNRSRLDALTPIINALNHPNLFYLKESGVYKIADKHFTVMSVFDKPKDFIRANQFNGEYKIALHHGAVNNATTDIGFVLQNNHVDIDLFEGYDLVLLGDIHKPAQFLNKEKTIAYSGSLIQQNHSEALYHGILIWDIKSKTAEFVVIENDFCFYTISVDAGVYDAIPDDLKLKNIRLRVKVKNTDASSLKQILADIRGKFTIDECRIQKITEFGSGKGSSKLMLKDVRDVEYQNELITKYLESKFALEDSVIDGVRHVNRIVNSNLPKTGARRNISWIPKRFEFSNMFSYGKNNVIDFTNMRGVYGLFAPNASGKSTLLDAIMYCIYDKCSRTSKAVSVLNNKSNSFSCTFNFELDGKEYFIERKAQRGRNNHVRVDVNFYILLSNGETESLNGKERSETNNNIRNILGTYEDFVLTALSVQNNNSGFIDMAQKDRKDLLSQFLDINIFEDLYNMATQEIKEVATLLKEYQRQDFAKILADSNANIKLYEKQKKSLQTSKNQLTEKIDLLNSKVIKHTEKLITIDSSIEDVDKLQDLQLKVKSLSTQISEESKKLHTLLPQLTSDLHALQNKLNTYDIKSIQLNIDQLKELKIKETSLLVNVERFKTELRLKLEKMKKLSSLEYDKNCSYCMNNVFVKDAIETKNSIESDKQELLKLDSEIEFIDSQIKKLSKSLEEKETYEKIQKSIREKESEKSNIIAELAQLESKTVQCNSKLSEIQTKIVDYHKKEAAIKENLQTKLEIDNLNKEISSLKNQVQSIDTDILSVHSKLGWENQTKLKSEESILKLKEYERQYKYFQYYLEAVNRDGIPYELISAAVPNIEQEINNILSQLVEFNLMLEMDGKNINCYIVYDSDNFWPIELTSGMEKFISSLAIRTALLNVSSLPRPNFLAIDEGLGNLDSEMLTEFNTLLNYLESRFTFIIMISHIESTKDMVSNLIEIQKSKGFSKINYV